MLKFCKKCKNLVASDICLNCSSEANTLEINTIKIKKQVKFDNINKRIKRATVKHICEKCGHNEAIYNIRQMRSADEGDSEFYTCIKCNHVVRKQ